MKTAYIWTIVLCMVLLTACSNQEKISDSQYSFLDNTGISVTRDLILGDTISMPDVYCGDPQQSVDDLKGWQLDPGQYVTLIVPAGPEVADKMSNWLLLSALSRPEPT